MRPKHGSEIKHKHPDVSGGGLRAATFGALDGLVTNISLVAGVGGAGANSKTIVLSGIAGLVAGAFSMALGEFSSVGTQNQQIDAETEVEKKEILNNAKAEKTELNYMLQDLGISEKTAQAAVEEIHQNPDKATQVHIMYELGLNPEEKPSKWLAAISSFIFFAIGAIFPIFPFFFGAKTMTPGLILGAVGLLLAGAIAAYITKTSLIKGALRQLAFGFIAALCTYLVGYFIGVRV